MVTSNELATFILDYDEASNWNGIFAEEAAELADAILDTYAVSEPTAEQAEFELMENAIKFDSAMTVRGFNRAIERIKREAAKEALNDRVRSTSSSVKH